MEQSGLIAIAAAIAIAVSTIFPALGQGMTAKSAMEAIARQPDTANNIRSTLIKPRNRLMWNVCYPFCHNITTKSISAASSTSF